MFIELTFYDTGNGVAGKPTSKTFNINMDSVKYFVEYTDYTKLCLLVGEDISVCETTAQILSLMDAQPRLLKEDHHLRLAKALCSR